MRTILVLLFTVTAWAQTARSVALSWTDTKNPAGTTYNAYRATAACTPVPTFTKINTAPISTKSYTDSNVSLGTYCYYVTAVGGGLESAPSNNAGAAVAPYPPEGLTGTVATAEITVKPDGELAAKLEVKSIPRSEEK